MYSATEFFTGLTSNRVGEVAKRRSFFSGTGFAVNAMTASQKQSSAAVSFGDTLSEIPDDWKKLTFQPTVRAVQSNLYAISETEWAVIREQNPFASDEPTYTVGEIFSSYEVDIPEATYPSALKTVDISHEEALTLKIGYEELVENIVAFWLQQENIKAKNALYIDGRITLTLKPTSLSTTLKGTYYRQITQTTLANKTEANSLQQLIDEVRNTDTFTVNLKIPH